VEGAAGAVLFAGSAIVGGVTTAGARFPDGSVGVCGADRAGAGVFAAVFAAVACGIAFLSICFTGVVVATVACFVGVACLR